MSMESEEEIDYNGAFVQFSLIEPNPVLKITIPKTNALSREVLKAELDSLFSAKYFFELLGKDILNNIQVIIFINN